MNDNVVKMPDTLERLASGIKADLAKAADSRDAWIEHIVAAAIKIAKARELHKDDIGFGKWWDAQNFDLNAHDRAALIVMGKDPEQMRKVFTATARNSIKHIFANEWRFVQMDKPTARASESQPSQPSKRQGSNRTSSGGAPPKSRGRQPVTRERVKEIIRTFQAKHDDVYPTRDEIDDIVNNLGFKISHATSDQALGEIKAEDETRLMEAARREAAIREAREEESAKSVKFTKAQDHHVEAKIRGLTKALEKDFAARRAALEKEHAARRAELEKEHKAWLDTFHQRLLAEVDAATAKRFPLLQEKENKAYRMEQLYTERLKAKAFFTREQAKLILMCLHPDGAQSRTREKLNDAFLTFNAKLLQLTGEAELQKC